MGHHVEGEVDSECLALLYFSLDNRGRNVKGSPGHQPRYRIVVRAFLLSCCMSWGWMESCSQSWRSPAWSYLISVHMGKSSVFLQRQRAQHQLTADAAPRFLPGLCFGLNWVPGCSRSLNAPIQSSCNHKIYNLMEIRAGVQRPCGLAVYHNDLCRSVNAVNRKPVPSSLTYLSFEKGQMLRLDVNNTLMMGMIKVPPCKGLGLKCLRVI